MSDNLRRSARQTPCETWRIVALSTSRQRRWHQRRPIRQRK